MFEFDCRTLQAGLVGRVGPESHFGSESHSGEMSCVGSALRRLGSGLHLDTLSSVPKPIAQPDLEKVPDTFFIPTFFIPPGGAVRIEVLCELETFWMNQKGIAELFGVDLRTVSEHLQNVYTSGELDEKATIRKIRRVQIEGNREVRRESRSEELVLRLSVISSNRSRNPDSQPRNPATKVLTASYHPDFLASGQKVESGEEKAEP
jgi:hypothetical protein